MNRARVRALWAGTYSILSLPDIPLLHRIELIRLPRMNIIRIMNLGVTR